MQPLRKCLLAAVVTGAAVPAGHRLHAQVPVDSVTPAGVSRASAVVDAVFVDKLLPEGRVGAGDWASYLMARLGIVPIPADLRVRVASDSTRVVISSMVGELPADALAALGPIVGMLPPTTVIAGDITVLQPTPDVVQFHLDRIRVNGAPLPDALVTTVMREVGRQYPALSKSGRNLYVQVPAGAAVRFLPGSVQLVGPPPDSGGRAGR